MQLCAITDRKRASEPLLSQVNEWSNGGVHFIHLREKDLDSPALESLARKVREKLEGSPTKLLVNISSPAFASLALAAGAHGVHLAGRPRPGAAESVRRVLGQEAIVSVPCHNLEDVAVAVEGTVDLVLFSPVFEKHPTSLTHGLEGLHQACAVARGMPVFALGGVTSSNALACVGAGAAGIAGIRLFAGDDWRGLGKAK